MKDNISDSSMLPLLQSNDVLYYKKISFAKTKVNDLIIVKKHDKSIAHRVIYKNKKYFVTKGDNNREPDEKIYPNQFIAKVSEIKRNGQIFNPESLYLLQSTLYFQEIVKIKKTFEREKIDYVFLKGLLLHLYFEQQYPRRIYADCDILVNKSFFKQIDAILQKIHFKKKKEDFKRFQTFVGKDEKEVTYYKKIHGLWIYLDIHSEITFLTHQVPIPFPSLQKTVNQITERFLNKKKIVLIKRIPFPVLDQDDLIFYLLLHFFTHNYSGIYRLEFINSIISSLKKMSPLYWEKLYKSAYSNGLLNFIIPGIYLLYKYYHVKRPFIVLQKKYYRSTMYALFIYKYICKETSLLNSPYSIDVERFKHASLIFFLYDKFFLYKLVYFLNPRLLFHLFFKNILSI